MSSHKCLERKDALKSFNMTFFVVLCFLILVVVYVVCRLLVLMSTRSEPGIDVGTVIPKKIHQTWKVRDTSDGFHTQLITRHGQLNPEWEIMFYDDNDIEDFLRRYFPSTILNAYLRINSRYGAARADFFRYCVLYVHGGVYLDIKSGIRKKLDSMRVKIDPMDMYNQKDILIVGHWPTAVWGEILEDPKGEFMNWVMLSTPRHPVLYEVIQDMITNILGFHDNHLTQFSQYSEKLGHKYSATFPKYMVLQTTGPLMFSRVLWRHRKDPSILVSDTMIHEFFEYTAFHDYMNAYRNVHSLHYSLVNDEHLVFQ